MRRLMLAIPMVMLVGCSGSMSGQVAGHNLSVADAIFAVLKDNSGKSTGLLVVMADKPKICDSLKANREPKQSTALFLSMSRVTDTDTLAPDVGEYTVIEGFPTKAGNYAYSTFSRSDANCDNTVAPSARDAKSGLVKLTNLKAEANGAANATFDITFGSGDKVTGNFNATYCDVTNIQTNPNCE